MSPNALTYSIRGDAPTMSPNEQTDIAHNLVLGTDGYTWKITTHPLREAFELKNVPKTGKSPKGGGGVRKKIKKSKISKFFIFFPNVNVDLKCFS